jgi:hypothetical protein
LRRIYFRNILTFAEPGYQGSTRAEIDVRQQMADVKVIYFVKYDVFV